MVKSGAGFPMLATPDAEALALELLANPVAREIEVVERGTSRLLVVTEVGAGPIETPFGNFIEICFTVSDEWRDYHVLLPDERGDHRIRQPTGALLVRIDSGCVSGQLFHDLTCECRDQLQDAMRMIHGRGEGVIIAIPRQDGRGMGLPFKLATLKLQKSLDLDTVDAALALVAAMKGVPVAQVAPAEVDRRTYAGAVSVLKCLGITENTSIALMTNNKAKAAVLWENSYRLARVPLVVPPTARTARHLAAKREKLGHLL